MAFAFRDKSKYSEFYSPALSQARNIACQQLFYEPLNRPADAQPIRAETLRQLRCIAATYLN